MSLRDLVWTTLRGDVQLQALLGNDSVLVNFASDSPASTLQRWIVLRWGVVERPPGRDTTARPVALTLAAYDRERDYEVIDNVLSRSRTVLRGLEGSSAGGGGYVIDVGPPQETSEDGYDEGYGAIVKSDTYRIVASGT